MTLHRTPLRANREHDWEDEGRNEWRCTRCMARRWSPTEPDADVFPCSGLRRSGLQRNKRVNPVSETNSGREHQKDEAFRGWVRRQPCVVCGARPCDAAHVSSWGSGAGDWIEPVWDFTSGEVQETKEGNLVSLCRQHHSEQHAVGIETFQERHDVDLEAKAVELGERFRAHRPQEGTDGDAG